MQLGYWHAKSVKTSSSGRLANEFAAFGKTAHDILSKWAMMIAACCPIPPCSHDNDELAGTDEMSPEELSSLRKVFDVLDANQDGFLTLEELCSWMQKLGRPMTKAGLLKILQSCDWNNDGRLDFNEFVALTQTLQNDEYYSGEVCNNGCDYLNTCNCDEGEDDSKCEMREAFQVFDKDGNGLISPLELRATLCELGLLSSPSCLSRIHSMIKKVDVDGDGQVSFSEFESMMNGNK